MNKNSKLTASTITGIGLQVFRPALSLLTLPIIHGLLGADYLGLWLIALSMFGLVGFVSTGFGIGLVTRIGRESADWSIEKLSSLMTVAFFVALGFSFIFSIIGFLIVKVVDWSSLLHVKENLAIGEFKNLLYILVFLLALGFFAGVLRALINGLGEGYLSNSADIVGSLIGFIGLALVVDNGDGLFKIGLVFLVPPYLVMILVGVIYVKIKGINIFTWRGVERDKCKEIIKDSFKMSLYQGAYAISSQTDLLLIGSLLGPSASAAYGLAQRVFSIPVLLMSAVNQAQWPFMAIADSLGKVDEVKSMLLKTAALGLVFSIGASLIIVSNYDAILNIWIGEFMQSDTLLIIGMSVWVVIITTTNLFDSVLRAKAYNGLLMRSMVRMAICNLAVSFLLVGSIGSAGAIFGTVLSSFVFLFLPFAIKVKKEIFVKTVEAK